MSISVFRALAALALPLLLAVAAPSVAPAQSKPTKKKPSLEQRREEERRREYEEEEEREREAAERARAAQRKPLQWGGGIVVEPVEGSSDTVRFHIGSPLLLRLRLTGDAACEPFNGQPFYFDAAGAQLGWGFEEVSDSSLFPRDPGNCERIVMLSSENSNRIAEGVYSMKVMIFLDEKSRLFSDTIHLHPIRSTKGADDISYSRFLLEQIVKNTPLLHDAETIQALFAEGTPRSAESEVYRALILYRGGDISGSETSLRAADDMVSRRKRPLDNVAAPIAERLTRLLRGEASAK